MLSQGQALRAQILQESGWRGLFNGLQPSLVGTAVSQGVYFYFYSALRQLAIARHQRRTGSASVVRAHASQPCCVCDNELAGSRVR